jgi:hypothetical protein
MQKFKRCTGINNQFIGWVTACANKTPETKCRTQPFATSQHQPRYFINGWNQISIHLRPAFALYGKQCLQAFVYARGNVKE